MNKKHNNGIVPTIQEGKLAIPGVGDANIRVTPDGRVSVYDFIKACMGGTNSRMTWKSLCATYPELVKLAYQYKFPGRGGAARPTPVVGRDGVIELMQVLPGKVGAKFRREIAQVVLRYFDGDVTLAAEIADRANAKGKADDVDWLAARVQGIQDRNYLTSACKRHGVYGAGYRNVTNAAYLGLFQQNASGLRKQKQLPPNANVRQHLSTAEIQLTSTTERAIANSFDKANAFGNTECSKIAFVVARKIADIVSGGLYGN